MPNTLELALSATVISVLIGVPIGIVSAVHHDTWIDRTSQISGLISVSMRNFWLGYLLLLVCLLWLGLTPIAGARTLSRLVTRGSLGSRLDHMLAGRSHVLGRGGTVGVVQEAVDRRGSRAVDADLEHMLFRYF